MRLACLKAHMLGRWWPIKRNWRNRPWIAMPAALCCCVYGLAYISHFIIHNRTNAAVFAIRIQYWIRLHWPSGRSTKWVAFQCISTTFGNGDFIIATFKTHWLGSFGRSSYFVVIRVLKIIQIIRFLIGFFFFFRLIYKTWFWSIIKSIRLRLLYKICCAIVVIFKCRSVVNVFVIRRQLCYVRS